MPFCHHPRSYASKVVSTRKSKATREKDAGKAAKGGQEKKIEFEGEIYQKQMTFESYTYLSYKGKSTRDQNNQKNILTFPSDDDAL